MMCGIKGSTRLIDGGTGRREDEGRCERTRQVRVRMKGRDSVQARRMTRRQETCWARGQSVEQSCMRQASSTHCSDCECVSLLLF